MITSDLLEQLVSRLTEVSFCVQLIDGESDDDGSVNNALSQSN